MSLFCLGLMGSDSLSLQKIEQLKIDGYNIRTLSEADFNRIVNGKDSED